MGNQQSTYEGFRYNVKDVNVRQPDLEPVRVLECREIDVMNPYGDQPTQPFTYIKVEKSFRIDNPLKDVVSEQLVSKLMAALILVETINIPDQNLADNHVYDDLLTMREVDFWKVADMGQFENNKVFCKNTKLVDALAYLNKFFEIGKIFMICNYSKEFSSTESKVVLIIIHAFDKALVCNMENPFFEEMKKSEICSMITEMTKPGDTLHIMRKQRYNMSKTWCEKDPDLDEFVAL